MSSPHSYEDSCQAWTHLPLWYWIHRAMRQPKRRAAITRERPAKASSSCVCEPKSLLVLFWNPTWATQDREQLICIAETQDHPSPSSK